MASMDEKTQLRIARDILIRTKRDLEGTLREIDKGLARIDQLLIVDPEDRLCLRCGGRYQLTEGGNAQYCDICNADLDALEKVLR